MELRADEVVEQDLVEIVPGRTDLVFYTHGSRTLRRVDGATGKPAWPEDFVLTPENVPRRP
jgi:hypothetical protein